MLKIKYHRCVAGVYAARAIEDGKIIARYLIVKEGAGRWMIYRGLMTFRSRQPFISFDTMRQCLQYLKDIPISMILD